MTSRDGKQSSFIFRLIQPPTVNRALFTLLHQLSLQTTIHVRTVYEMTMSAPFGVQGRLFSEQLFPAQMDECNFFMAKSRCLIDMGNSFLVVPEGDNLSPYQKRMFRLECKREDLQLKGDSSLSKEDCVDLLRSMLDELPRCDIVRTDFPYFDRQETLIGQYKDRPCFALFGDDGMPPLFVGAFLGALKEKDQNSEFVVVLKAPGHLLPEGVEDSWLDCSKIASFPDFYNLPGDRWRDKKATYEPWPVDQDSQLRTTNPDALRQVVVD